MNAFQKIISSGVLLFSLASCESFLTETPLANVKITPLRTSVEALPILNGVYAEIIKDASSNFFMVNELPADDGFLYVSESLPVPDRYKMEQIMFTSDIGMLQTAWERYYKIISRANDLIAAMNYDRNAETPSQIVGEKDRLKMFEIEAQGRFLRAYSYFNLVRWFGGVPLLTQPVQVGTPEFTPTRATKNEVYALIQEDLRFANTWLQKTMYPYADSKNGGRVTQAAARVCAAKVLMTLAGADHTIGRTYQPGSLNTEQMGYLSQALDTIKPLINSPSAFGIGYEPDYAKIFDVEKKAENKEAIFYLQGAGDINLFTGLHSYFWKWNGGLHPGRLVYEQYDVFEIGTLTVGVLGRDDRVNTTFGVPGNGQKLPPNPATSANGTYVAKWTDFAYSETSRNDMQLFRYSDVRLMYSELRCMIDGWSAETDVKAILKTFRCDHGKFNEQYVQTHLTEQVTNIDRLFAEVKMERRRELMFEGHRRFDLIRWGEYPQRMKESLSAQYGIPLSEYDRITDIYNLFPLPLKEFTVNTNLGEQNPGYTK